MTIGDKINKRINEDISSNSMGIGDMITCMCGAEGTLTIYKTYEVLNVYTAYGVTKVLIKDDSGQHNYVPQYCFIFQDEFRQDQLNKVLN